MLKLTLLFARDERGATSIEYGLIAGAIAIVLATVMTTLGNDLTAAFQRIMALFPETQT
ncbi:Flp family type IVb pilin [Asticcacaulis excentricus]|uniref:Flp/Fap pilin component n=1 Tax=Asticcacaulis excentricus TaxID=78587 RepID=A0A3G9G0Z9_9CAUL|nr:Flp family type IVb pilin [Asticcacaulis excentricus]BBF81002.1 hypothetical protein EM6_1596 [Asticcacaulis excentricus]